MSVYSYWFKKEYLRLLFVTARLENAAMFTFDGRRSVPEQILFERE